MEFDMPTQLITDARQLTRAAAAALNTGSLFYGDDGRLALLAGLNNAALGQRIAGQTEGLMRMPKAASVVMLPGQEAHWIPANANISYAQPHANSYRAGYVARDAAAADETVDVWVTPHRFWAPNDIHAGEWDNTVAVAAGACSPLVGGGVRNLFTTAGEAQKSSAIAKRPLTATQGLCFEAVVNQYTAPDNAASVFRIGLASGDHATELGSATLLAAFSRAGGDALVLFESDDNGTDTAPVTTGVTCVTGTPLHLMADLRPTMSSTVGINAYVNGARVASGTVFRWDAATGSVYAIVHLVKSSDDSPGDYRTTLLRAWATRAA